MRARNRLLSSPRLRIPTLVVVRTRYAQILKLGMGEGFENFNASGK